MKATTLFISAVLSCGLLISGCQDKQTPVSKAVEGTKDALDMRDHEKIKDAGEDMKDAVDNAAQGIKDETK